MILFMWLDLFTRMYYMYFCTHLLLYADDNNNNNDRLTAFDPGQPG